MQPTSDWVVALQLNSAVMLPFINTLKEVTQELTVNMPGVSKACQLRGWTYLAAHFHLSINVFPGGAGELQPEH